VSSAPDVDYQVDVTFDDDASVWLVTSPNVIGLTLEYDSLDRLESQLVAAVKELLELNNQPPARHIDVAIRRRVLAYA